MPDDQNYLLEAIDLADINITCLHDLSALFSAIHSMSQDNTAIQRVAGMGAYLADDFANLIQNMRDGMSERGGEHE